MIHYAYRLEETRARKRLGLIALQSDETVERDLRTAFRPSQVDLLVSRVPSGEEVTTETLGTMATALAGAAALFPRGLKFDAVGYGCTSGTSVIGAQKVAAQVQAGTDTDHVTEPVSALLAAARTLGVQRLAFLSPYIAEVSAHLRHVLAGQGLTTVALGGFDEANEARVARIDPEDVFRAGADLGQAPQAEALFLSCTNLQTFDVLDRLEAELGKPVLSSNQVMAWHMARLSGAPVDVPGRLGGGATSAA